MTRESFSEFNRQSRNFQHSLSLILDGYMILDPAQRKLVRWHNIIRAHIFGLTARFLLQEIKMKEEIIDCMLNGGLLLIL